MNHEQKKLPIGKSDFRIVIRDNCYYIDKSLFVREITGASPDVLLIPRPRRFGKTLNLSMLRYFFEKSDEDTGTLFKRLAVSGEEIFKEHQGRYPVIWLTFKDMKALSWDNLYEGLCRLIRREIERHNDMLNWDGLSQSNREYFESLIRSEASVRDYEDSLLILSEQLSCYHSKEVVILIDEYDTPIHAGYANGYYEEVVSFIKNFLSGGLKDNVHLFKGVLTGILRVARESVFSGLNNLAVHTLLDSKFSDAFGFTEPEVRQILEDYGMKDRYEEVSYWYDGYRFGDTVIYNPWSVLSYIYHQGKPDPYWINTGSTDIIENLATRGRTELREELGDLLEGRTITKPVYENVVMRDLEKRDDLLWSFMLFSGYLRCGGKPVRKNYYELEIPNEEVRMIYEELVEQWFAEKFESDKLERLLNALESGEVEEFEELLADMVEKVLSVHDTGGKEPEKFYHAFVLGLLVWLEGKYEIRSNRESGLGRYDVILIPRDRSKQGIIIEFKKVNVRKKETPEKALDRAVRQIEEKRYVAELESAGVQDILKLAIAFRGKELWVREL